MALIFQNSNSDELEKNPTACLAILMGSTFTCFLWLPRWCSGKKKSACNAKDSRNKGTIPELGRSPGRRYGNPLQYSCLGNSMGRGEQRSLTGYSSWDPIESDMTKQPSIHMAPTKQWIKPRFVVLDSFPIILWENFSTIPHFTNTTFISYVANFPGSRVSVLF